MKQFHQQLTSLRMRSKFYAKAAEIHRRDADKYNDDPEDAKQFPWLEKSAARAVEADERAADSKKEYMALAKTVEGKIVIEEQMVYVLT